ncbi:MAG TPA: methyltransferase domain-containing protein [Candidatus Hydrogenedentes bacterium]|mgnify:CR=1 FL=1|nr:methyltransferase domain-containing protein [Candidatus Hydrogenedentota bacterium]
MPGRESAVNTSKSKGAPRMDGAPVLQRMAEAHRFGKHDRILCYGCGYGADVSWFRARKYTVHGYDPHPPFGYSELPKGKFEYVFMIYLMTRLKTLENRRAAINRAAQYVRPGGYLVIVTRQWARLAKEAGEEGQTGAIRYFQQLLNGLPMSEGFVPDYEMGDQSLCIMFRRGGVYAPQKPIVWVDTAERLNKAVEQLEKEPQLALDVETTLGEPKVICTIQLGTPKKTFVIDALAFPDLGPIKRLMENTGIQKLIHNAQFEEQMFGKYGIRIRNIYDTLLVSRKKHRKGAVEGGHKLDDVCERELGIYLDKSLQTSDWTQRPITPEQLAYAAVDAEVLLDLYRVFDPPKPPETLSLF